MIRRTLVRGPALAAAMMAATGCTPQRADLRKNAEALMGLGASTPSELQGRLIAPKRCALRVAIVTRPFQDPLVNDALWSLTDEQAVDPDARRAIESNGLRLGVLTGELPPDLVKLFDEQAPITEKVVPTQVDLPDGDHTLIPVAPQVPQVDLLLNRDGRAVGKPYRDAQGIFRLTVAQEGEDGVRLRLIPQIHHGPVRHGYAAANVGPFAAQQFVVKDGQQEDMLRELSASVVVQPGQIAVLGARPEQNHSLGDFLFTHPEANSDRLVQKVVLIWAERSRLGNATKGSEAVVPPPLEAVDPPTMPEMAPTDTRPMAPIEPIRESGSPPEPGNR